MDLKGRTLNQRYAALLEHYGLKATRTNPRSSQVNGVAEQAHYRLKTAQAPPPLLKGSRDFLSVAAYGAFVQAVVNKRNRRVQGKLPGERPHLRPLPQAAVPEYTTWRRLLQGPPGGAAGAGAGRTPSLYLLPAHHLVSGA